MRKINALKLIFIQLSKNEFKVIIIDLKKIDKFKRKKKIKIFYRIFFSSIKTLYQI